MASNSVTHKNETTGKGSGLIKRINSFEVDGTLVGEGFLIKINHTKITLPDKFFQYIAILAVYRSRNDGWVDKEELEPGSNQSRNVYRMRKGIGKFVDPSCDPIESQTGSYRLNVSPDRIKFNVENLSNHGDAVVRNVFNSVYRSN